MKNKLQALYGQRFRFIATVLREGVKSSHWDDNEKSILLSQVRLDGKQTILAEQVWLTCSATLPAVQEGDQIAFEARVDAYLKSGSPENRQVDFKFSHPNQVTIVWRSRVKSINPGLYIDNPASRHYGKPLESYNGIWGIFEGQKLRLKPGQVSQQVPGQNKDDGEIDYKIA